MDSRPFLEIDLLDVHEPLVHELKKLTKASFNLEERLSAASELKYTREIRLIMEEQLREPSEEFVRFFASQVYAGRMTQTVLEQFTATTRRALHQFITDQISRRLQSALGEEEARASAVDLATGDETADGASTSPGQDRDSRIETTEEEIEGFHMVKAMLRESVDPKRIVARDTLSYFGILLDDNNRKPICRLHFNRSQKYLGLFDQERNEQRIPINDLNDLYQYAGQLKTVINAYDHLVSPQVPEEPSKPTGGGEYPDTQNQLHSHRLYRLEASDLDVSRSVP